ncbi:MAG: hypothetical protein AABX34_02555 [Nanoarchaeota archaeon]
MKNVAIMAVMLLLLIATVSAATIYGTIYDYSLEKAKNAMVEINTVPKQVYVSKNGSYAFDIPPGGYIIEAKQYAGSLLKASARENITIKYNGSYVLDLILFPNVEEGLEEDINIGSLFEDENLKAGGFVFALLILAAVAALLFVLHRNKAKKPESVHAENESYGEQDLEKIIRILKDEGGRTTQKEIRKQMPFSEAKVSLMIAELEHKGIIEKIKKGRGNIIILKK